MKVDYTVDTLDVVPLPDRSPKHDIKIHVMMSSVIKAPGKFP